MSETVMQLEASIRELSRDEQLWLIERMIHWMREGESEKRARWAASLDEMSNDPDIQRENESIAREFAVADNDGLERL